MAAGGQAWDQKARIMAGEAKAAIASHEEVCAVRWESAMQTMNEIKRVMAWGIMGLMSCMIGLITFLATHLIK